ncbi:MAG: FAD-binding oxidoreductase [Gammaproteobacteria bacterium]|nr:FAD-binding oxidoreductase [Gammaproteobacteria bacterium]
MANKGNSKRSTIVVGAGIVGTAIAFRLAQAGEDVMLLDRQDPGREASWGNAGHIATEQVFPLASPASVLRAPGYLLKSDGPLSIRPGYALQIAPWLSRFMLASRPEAFRRGTAALAALQSRALESFTKLCTDCAIAGQLHRRGHLILVERQSSVSAARENLASMAEHGISGEWLEPSAVAERAPELTRDVAGALLLHDTAHVGDPYRVCKGIYDAFVDAGGAFAREEVMQVDAGTPGTCRVRTAKRVIHGSNVVIAAGAWSKNLVEQLGYCVPLDTERGYNVTAEGWHGQFDVAIASHERNTIMTPLDRGLRITGFVEFGGLDLPPAQARLDTLKRHLQELIPGADMPDMSGWMGFRPSMPDHLPVLGASPQNENVLFAFGHQHLGLTLSGITADIIADLVLHNETSVDLAPYRVDRFSVL